MKCSFNVDAIQTSDSSPQFLTFDLQEILQVHPDAELRGVELQRWRQPGVPAQHHDGPEEVLQPPLPVPRGCCGEEVPQVKPLLPVGDTLCV